MNLEKNSVILECVWLVRSDYSDCISIKVNVASLGNYNIGRVCFNLS